MRAWATVRMRSNAPFYANNSPSAVPGRGRPKRPLIILQKYLLREWLLTFLAVSLVLTVVVFGLFFGELLRDVANGRMPTGLLGILLLLQIPEALGDILPLAAFIAVTWGLGRMYRDQEMAVMRSSGFDWTMMLRPLAVLVLPVAAVLLAVELVLAPGAAKRADVVIEDAFRTAGLWGLQAGRFHVLQDGDLVVYVEDIGDDGFSLENVFIQQRDGDREQVWYAAEGRYGVDPDAGHRYLSLLDGQVTEGAPDRLDYRIMTFERNDVRLPEAERRGTDNDIVAMRTDELLAADEPEASAELQWRVAPAIAVVVLGLLAIPLAHSGPREGRGGRVILAILAYAIYMNLLYLARAWIAGGVLAPELGMWAVHAIAAAGGILLLRRQGRSRIGVRR